AEHHAFGGARGDGRLPRQYVAEQRSRLDVAVQPALVGQRDGGYALLALRVRRGDEFARHREYRRHHVGRWKGVVAPGDAARDLQVDELVGPRVARDEIVDDLRPARLVVRIADRDRGEASLQACEVLRPAELAAPVDRNDFVDAVTEHEAAIEHGNPRLLERHPFAVQPSGLRHPDRVVMGLGQVCARTPQREISSKSKSQARPTQPARSTLDSARSGRPVTSCSPMRTRSVPICWFSAMGATSGWMRSISALTWSAWPRGTETSTSRSKPPSTVSSRPFHTS